MFRFSIRELMLVTVIVALIAGWSINCRQSVSELKQSQAVGSTAAWWRNMAVTLGGKLRDEGCYVTIDEDNKAWGFTPSNEISLDTSVELNNASPLPDPNAYPLP